jgi:hypothetical protein
MKKTQKKAIGIAAGAATLAAGAAALYFFSGKDGAKNRKKVGTWAQKFKKDVLHEMTNLQSTSKKSYHGAVDTVTMRYKALKKIEPSELAVLAKELKGHWDRISKELGSAKTKVQRSVKKAAPKKSPSAKRKRR